MQVSTPIMTVTSFPIQEKSATMLTRICAALAFFTAEAAATIYYAGVAESSGEFGVWSKCYHTCIGILY